MGFAVSQPLPFIMAVSQEWLFTFGADKVLHMPLFSHGINHTPFNRPPAGSTNRDTHLVMARQTVQLSFQLSGIGCKFFPTVGTVKVIRMVWVIFKDKSRLVNNRMALLANIFAQTPGFLSVVTRTAEMPASIFHKSYIGQHLIAQIAAETLWMPAIVHCLNDTANDKFSALMAARRKQHLEIMFAVLPALKLIEESFWELLEALGTHKALLVVQLPIAVHNLLCWGKA